MNADPKFCEKCGAEFKSSDKTNEMREALTKRLQAIRLASIGLTEYWWSEHEQEQWNELSDECIRQMQWAQHQTIETVIAAMDSGRSNPIAGLIIRSADPDPLTLAPEGWTPESEEA